MQKQEVNSTTEVLFFGSHYVYVDRKCRLPKLSLFDIFKKNVSIHFFDPNHNVVYLTGGNGEMITDAVSLRDNKEFDKRKYKELSLHYEGMMTNFMSHIHEMGFLEKRSNVFDPNNIVGYVVAEKQSVVNNHHEFVDEYYVLRYGCSYDKDGNGISSFSLDNGKTIKKGQMCPVDKNNLILVDGKGYNFSYYGKLKTFKLNEKEKAEAHSEKLKNAPIGYYLISPTGERLKGKKIGKLHEVLTFMRVQSGYHNEVYRYNDKAPDWLGTNEPIDIDELAKYKLVGITKGKGNKNIHTEFEGSEKIVADNVAAIKRNFSRIPLIAKYGFGINALFSALEKKGLEDYKYALVCGNHDIKDITKAKKFKDKFIRIVEEISNYYVSRGANAADNKDYFFAVKDYETLMDIYAEFNKEQQEKIQIADILNNQEIGIQDMAIAKVRDIRIEEFKKAMKNGN